MNCDEYDPARRLVMKRQTQSCKIATVTAACVELERSSDSSRREMICGSGWLPPGCSPVVARQPGCRGVLATCLKRARIGHGRAGQSYISDTTIVYNVEHGRSSRTIREATRRQRDHTLRNAGAFHSSQGAPQRRRELARELVRQNKLTKFQATEVWRGKGGSLVLDNYVLLDRIGAGGMGQVSRGLRNGEIAVEVIDCIKEKQ